MRINLKRLVMMLGLVLMTSIVCMAQSSTVVITSNFNGTNIGPGRWVYFNSVFNASGLSTSEPTVITLSGATLNIEGMVYPLPGAVITFDPNASTPSTQFVGGQWHTTIPRNAGGNKFLTAFPIFFPNGLPGGANPVVFTGTLSSNIFGVCGPVQWAAAVYTQMPSDLNQLGVKVTDQFGGSHHAGTPENYTAFVIGGARGGGGSNFTGSYSATGHYCSEVMTPTPTATATSTPTTTPSETPSVTPTPGMINLELLPCQPGQTQRRARFIGQLFGLTFFLNGQQVVPDANGEFDIAPGHYHWEVFRNGQLIASGEVDVDACGVVETPTPTETPTSTPTTTPTPGMTPTPTPPEVPEPGTILLLGTGLMIGLGVFAFRKLKG